MVFTCFCGLKLVNNINETIKAFGLAVSSFSDAYSFRVFIFSLIGGFTVSLTTQCYAGAVFLYCPLNFDPYLFLGSTQHG